jgi:hypothetical protein
MSARLETLRDDGVGGANSLRTSTTSALNGARAGPGMVSGSIPYA